MMNNFSVEGADDTPDVHPAQNTERNTLIFQHKNKNDSNSRSNIQTQIDKKKLAQAPIGVFDSGAGGLTILSALRERLPAEHYLYLGDTAYCPYGVRSEEEITALSIQNCQFLIDQ